MSDFAKSQLEKFGWTEGKGLGKNEDGMVEALKPKLKFDTTGIGHRDGSGNQWWNLVYDKASSNISVGSSSDNQPLFKVKQSNALEIAAAKLNVNIGDSKKTKDGLVYGNFLKTSTLEGNKETQSAAQKEQSKKKDDIVMFKDFIVDDEKLFKACGGRTAHKGARHGLKLSGKLARIEQQENDLVGQMSSLGDWSSDWCKAKRKNRKRLKKSGFSRIAESIMKKNHENCVEDLQKLRFSRPPGSVIDAIEKQLNDEDDEYQNVSKKSMRKLKRKYEDLTEKLSSSLCFDETEESSKKKLEDSECLDENSVDSHTKKKKKRREEMTKSEYLNHKISKKKKKKQRRKEKSKLELISKNLKDLDGVVVDITENLSKIKIKKKKNKSKS